ncbi:segregation/condensation protein A [Pedobacter sp. HMF7056]|uniref:Segregation and condensation protein A n=1 Tax=Hufsiella ginkgonis TaxID=2695274 RepID=A0A7K1Y3B8_9SPHI|nr:segregation/condensation protein A [Hufsiella ginkgonis]
MSADTFEIKLPQFEGPFDLLLFFIERDELDIHNISISKITDDFLEYIHRMNSLNIELASEFIVVAATLMRIKARMLLPRFDPEDDELDPRKDLVQKLIEYKKIKLVTGELRVLEHERFLVEKRGTIAEDVRQAALIAEPGEELASFDLYRLLLVYDRLMSKYKKQSEQVVHTVVQYPYSIEQQKKIIADLILLNKKMDFKQILRSSDNRVHFVYNFLAVLEMLQQQLISIQVGLGYNNFWVEEKNLS